jgi:ATP-dependent DNA ligase
MFARRARTDGFVDPCIPTLAAKPPSGPDWVHEIKHDGYRLMARRDGKAASRREHRSREDLQCGANRHAKETDFDRV